MDGPQKHQSMMMVYVVFFLEGRHQLLSVTRLVQLPRNLTAVAAAKSVDQFPQDPQAMCDRRQCCQETGF